MKTNTHKIVDYDKVLDAKFGKEGTAQRAKHEADAKAFYAAQILLQARKESKITQQELATRVGITKSYISKIENGLLEPGVGLFFRLLSALDLQIDVKHI